MDDRIVMLTAYDYPTGKLLDEAGVDIVLVGDSLAMTVLGHKDTKKITMDEMLHHVKATAKGVKNAILVADMPIKSYGTPALALKNAKRFIKAGADVVKIEGYKPKIVEKLLTNKIKVMCHLGLLPQTARKYTVQGRTARARNKMLKEALDLDSYGIFALVLECVPSSLAREITEKTGCSTLGIGAGPYCDGQVLVLNDLLGLYEDLTPKFVRMYAHLGKDIKKAVENYAFDVRKGNFPSKKESFK